MDDRTCSPTSRDPRLRKTGAIDKTEVEWLEVWLYVSQLPTFHCQPKKHTAMNENVHQLATFIGVILNHRAQSLFRRKKHTHTPKKGMGTIQTDQSLSRGFSTVKYLRRPSLHLHIWGNQAGEMGARAEMSIFWLTSDVTNNAFLLRKKKY